jgi:hypothetical protein
VELLGDLPLERHGRNLDRVDAREGQKIRCRERVVLLDWIGRDSDVEEKGLELPPARCAVARKR